MSQNLIAVCISVLFAVFVRWSVSLNSYSGAGIGPMFGDFEAQRHWMEITHHLPLKEWYFNTSGNDLMYWGLDYPPLTAYHSKICGYIAHLINPEWVALKDSRGTETYEHKLFMRYTVLLADLLVYVSAVLVYCYITVKDKTPLSRVLAATVLLVYPGLVLIDHGHFQYNCVSLGFALWAVIGLATDHDLLGSIAFVLALNYKQMELYHALPFFCYLLGKCLRSEKENWLWKLIKIGTVVIATFILCWLPFVSDVQVAQQVLNRLFPVARGVFEDKVSNFWCTISIIIKLKSKFSADTMLAMTLVSTLTALIPSSVHLLIRPTINNFKLALVNSSLIFFLFSYQVHEKSILIAALPVCLLLLEKPFFCLWFLLMSTFSMLPLLIKDGLFIPYLVTMALFLMLVTYTFAWKAWELELFTQPPNIKYSDSIFTFNTAAFLQAWFYVSMAEIFLLSLLPVVKAPPSRFPDLWPVIISAFCCVHFLGFLVYFHLEQFLSSFPPKSIEAKKNA
ncbi:dolichyl pyrophosphate Man9GlcNAc2 alpha-1,3-glucosyltransferase-like [Ptychodera flava]|uniref:dolichyl pyrophosphate Man9GlcNAc2 alpha-1,3-glucosyltransferase-like n=1 Tax=Ptychodera flava TaxID=63121 RepID=UPI00396A051E